MGHCISIHIIKKDQLRRDKLEKLVGTGDGIDLKLKYIELGGDVVAVTDFSDEKEFLKNRTVVFITTDYFGGIGNQTAKVYENGKVIYHETDEFEFNRPINTALKMIGVVKEVGIDEFDTIGLGGYRSHKYFENNDRK